MTSDSGGASVTVSFSDSCTDKLQQIVDKCELKEKLPLVQLAISLALLNPHLRSSETGRGSGRGYTINRGSLDPDNYFSSAVKVFRPDEGVDAPDELRLLGEQGIDLLHSYVVGRHMGLAAAIGLLMDDFNARH